MSTVTRSLEFPKKILAPYFSGYKEPEVSLMKNLEVWVVFAQCNIVPMKWSRDHVLTSS